MVFKDFKKYSGFETFIAPVKMIEKYQQIINWSGKKLNSISSHDQLISLYHFSCYLKGCMDSIQAWEKNKSSMLDLFRDLSNSLKRLTKILMLQVAATATM